jgi:hypothetical protein
MSAVVTSERVPVEFVGLARSLRNRITQSDLAIGPAMDRIAAYGNEIMSRRHSFRPEHLSHLERQWRTTIPALGRLGFATERRKGRLVVADVRLFASSFRRLSWRDDAYEDALSLFISSGRFGPDQVSIKHLPIAAISLHAIARRYQRSFDSSDEAVFRDLSEIALHVGDLLGLAIFRQPAGDGGWHGSTVQSSYNNCEQRILSVRTFI